MFEVGIISNFSDKQELLWASFESKISFWVDVPSASDFKPVVSFQTSLEVFDEVLDSTVSPTSSDFKNA